MKVFQRFCGWLGDVCHEASGYRDFAGLYADQVVDNLRLEDRVAELETALQPFAECGALMCTCKSCGKGTLEMISPSRGRAILTVGDFQVARRALSGEPTQAVLEIPF